jgi:exopolysaccharide production protein ExoZ
MHLLSLQVLRAIAAISVVICHAGIQLNYWTNTTIAWSSVGAAGVDLFFVISGFIITLVSWNSFGRIDQIAPFLARRAIRIGFLYWLLTTIYVLANSYPLSRIVASYLLLPVDGWHVISVAWTLVYEVMFYLVFAACLVLPRIFGLAAVVAALIGLTFSPIPFYSNPLILEFLFGIGAAVAYRDGIRLPAVASLLLIAAGFATYVVTATYPEHSVVWWGIPAAMILIGAVLAPELPSNRFWRWFALIGDASYALYLTHLPIMRFAGYMAGQTGLDFASSPFFVVAYFVICVASAICVALLVFKVIEEPVLEAWKRRLRRPISVPVT